MTHKNTTLPTGTSETDTPKTLRKLLKIGHSFAVTLPSPWVRRHVPIEKPYLICHDLNNGTIQIEPFQPN